MVGVTTVSGEVYPLEILLNHHSRSKVVFRFLIDFIKISYNKKRPN